MQYVQVESAGRLTTVTIARPEALNALNPEVLGELASAFDQIDTRQVRAVIFTGAGDKAFVAGADINELATMQAMQAKDVAYFGQQVFTAGERGVVFQGGFQMLDRLTQIGRPEAGSGLAEAPLRARELGLGQRRPVFLIVRLIGDGLGQVDLHRLR